MKRLVLAAVCAVALQTTPEVVFAQAAKGTRLPESSVAAAWRTKGLEFGYNLDRQEAFDAFRHAIDADPTSSTAYRLLAGSAWTQMVFDQGAITVDDFLGEARAKYKRPAPNADLVNTFGSQAVSL